MVSTNKENILAVLSLSGGNDGLNTVIPVSYTHLTLTTICRV